MKNLLKTIVAFCMILLITSCGSNTETTEKKETIPVETKYCTLQVPKDFDGKVKWDIDDEPYSIDFKTSEGDMDLFEISFNEEDGDLLGTLVLEEENVVLYADFAEIDSEDSKYKELAGYQEGINTIIDGLTADYDFRIDEVVDVNEGKTFDIETSVATLKYPLKWKDVVNVDVQDNKVAFATDEEKLFDLEFGKSEGFLLGTYDGTEIYVVTYEIDSDKYSENEYMNLSGMQNDINVIVENLEKDSKFEINKG